MLQVREVIVTGTFRYANTGPAATALVAAGRVELDPQVTGHFGWADVEQAPPTGSSGAGATKAVVHPQWC